MVKLVYSSPWLQERYVCKLLNLQFGDMEIICLDVALYALIHFSLAAILWASFTALPTTIRTTFILVLFWYVTLKYLNFHFLCSKSTLTLVTTTWPRQRSRTNSCRRRQHRRRRRSQATTSPPRRTCPRGNPLWWPANWQADADTTSAACPALPLQHLPVCNITPTLTSHNDLPPPPSPTPPSRLAVTLDSCSF